MEQNGTAAPGEQQIFSRRIDLGHILTFIWMAVAVMVTWGTLDKRVVVLEEARRVQAERDAAQDARMTERMLELRESLGKIERHIESVREKLERDTRAHPPRT